MTRAVIFDFNGTLSHDEPVLCAIYCELAAEHGRQLSASDYYASLSGLAETAIAEAILGPGDPEIATFIRRRIDRYRERIADGSTIPPELREAVRYAAARVPLAIVSGAAREEIFPVLEAAGLADAFGIVVADDDVEHGKPHPEGYRRAVELLGVDVADTLAFEDTEAGIASAQGAGTRVVALLGTQSPERLALAEERVEAIDVELMRRLLG